MHIRYKPMASEQDWDWREDAACAEIGHEPWYPERGEPGRRARRICFSCSVRTDCLEYALANDEPHGIWGGLSERERRKLRPAPGRAGTRRPGTVTDAIAGVRRRAA